MTISTLSFNVKRLDDPHRVVFLPDEVRDFLDAICDVHAKARMEAGEVAIPCENLDMEHEFRVLAARVGGVGLAIHGHHVFIEFAGRIDLILAGDVGGEFNLINRYFEAWDTRLLAPIA